MPAICSRFFGIKESCATWHSQPQWPDHRMAPLTLLRAPKTFIFHVCKSSLNLNRRRCHLLGLSAEASYRSRHKVFGIAPFKANHNFLSLCFFQYVYRIVSWSCAFYQRHLVAENWFLLNYLYRNTRRSFHKVLRASINMPMLVFY